MESNFKTQNICTKECLLKSENDISIEAEFVLPDYCPPIKRVLNFRAEPAVSSKNISGNMMNIEGIACFKLIYLDDRDELNCYEGALVFSKNLECEFELNNSQINATASGERINCKVVSDRKIEVKGSVVVRICMYNIREQKCICADIGDSFEVLRTKVPSDANILFAEKSLILEEEMALSDSHAQIGRILNYSAQIMPDACKVMNNKVMLKGSVLIRVTYLSAENFAPCHFEQKIPYSQVCDIDGADESFKCKTTESLIFLEVKCRNGGYDEMRTMQVNAKLCIGIEAYCEAESEVVLDIYSTDKIVDTNCESLFTRCLADRISDTFTAKKTLEFSQGSIGSVVDMWSEATVTGIKQNEGCVSVFGIVYVRMIVCDSGGRPEYCERAIDFEYKYKLPDELCNIDFEASVSISDLSYVIKSDSCIEVTSEMSVCLEIFRITEQKVITSVAVNEEAGECGSDCAVIVCYVDTETDLWSIAKKYKSSVSEIMELNSIDKNCKTVSGAVVIPVK